MPIDDTHTQVLTLSFIRRGADGGGRWQGDGGERATMYRDANGEYPLTTFPSQDAMAWETEGPIFDRTREHLGASDMGIALFRGTVSLSQPRRE